MNRCPILTAGLWASPDLAGDSHYGNCLFHECAWWNTQFEMCSMAVDAYLKAIEAERRENAILTKQNI